MSAYERDLAQFADLDAQVLGISVDSVYSHVAWQEHATGRLSFPLACDFYPHGAVAESYGVFRPGPPIPGINDRAVFLVDKQGAIAFAELYDLGGLPDNDKALNILRKLQSVTVDR